jgi:hypothetical protein
VGKAEGENTTHHMERGVGLQQRTDTIYFRRKESCKAGRELACRTMALYGSDITAQLYGARNGAGLHGF